MLTLMYSSASSAFTEKQYLSANKLINAIFAEKKKNRVLIERNRFTYIPGNGTRKMIIRLKHL